MHPIKKPAVLTLAFLVLVALMRVAMVLVEAEVEVVEEMVALVEEMMMLMLLVNVQVHSILMLRSKDQCIVVILLRLNDHRSCDCTNHRLDCIHHI